MTIEEFKKRASEDDEWAPGWDVIDEALDELYGDAEFQHFGTNIVARAMFGGNEYLDGYSIYTSPKGYKHIITYGMTVLYADEESFGGEYNGWGYEMTIKLKETDNEKCMWAINMMANLARYTYTQKRFFEPYQYVSGNGSSVCLDNPDSKITALLVVEDTELKGRDSIYGRTDFLQLVGITQSELEALKADHTKAEALAELIKKDYPDLETDMNRTHSYM